MMWQWVGLFAAALAALSPQEERQAIGAVRRPMCEAIVDEMHIEIAKHTLRKDGEDDVWETVPAICLAIVQNYTLVRTAPPSRGWLLDKRAVRLDDLEPGDTSPADFEHLLLLKKACEHYTEEWQHELSGAMYTRTAAGLSANKIASDLCDDVAPPLRPKRKARASGGGGGGGGKAKKGSGKGSSKGGKKGSSRGGEGEGVPSMDELLQKYDTDGTITRLMELERESPEARRCRPPLPRHSPAHTRTYRLSGLGGSEGLHGLGRLLLIAKRPPARQSAPQEPCSTLACDEPLGTAHSASGPSPSHSPTSPLSPTRAQPPPSRHPPAGDARARAAGGGDCRRRAPPVRRLPRHVQASPRRGESGKGAASARERGGLPLRRSQV